ncbi:hypothetical protein [Desertibaculum subflavum]|uniref:hypothetical protein n=1 Tax=Desertibaculum subflavum TaxID=2268458 RepID=UPI0013C4F1D1
MMAPTRARSTPPPPLPPAPAGEVRRPALQFPANDNRPKLRGILLAIAAGLAFAIAYMVFAAL